MTTHDARQGRALVFVSLAIILFGTLPAAGSASSLRSPATPSAGAELTLEQRVEYQRRIDEVTWRHTLWPAENRRPKPALDEVLPRSATAARVADDLRKAGALGTYYRRPLTPAQVQAEIERMASHSQQPAVLREIWSALDGDPRLVAECLARPALADRLLRSWFAADDRWHGATRERAEADLRAGGGRRTDADLTGVGTEEAGTIETAVAALAVGHTSDLLEAEDQFYAVTVRERRGRDAKVTVASWPKLPFETWWREAAGQIPATAAVVDADYALPSISRSQLAADSWSPTSFMPRPRESHVAVWTGAEMLVWGGILYYPETGARYSPATDSWHSMSIVGEPSPRSRPSAVWTGTEMIVWGGWGGSDVNNLLNTGGRYNPATDTWAATSTGANVPAGRNLHATVWTGAEMIVWGGVGASGAQFGSGARYDPVADAWSPVSTANAPAGRANPAAVWTGTEMIVWGGRGAFPNPQTYFDTGGRYDPASDTWTPMAVAGAPAGRTLHSAVWTGSEMVVWGGSNNSGFTLLNDGGRYDPASDTWSPTSLAGAPAPRSSHTAVWTGARMTVWGGCASHDCSYQHNSGGRYDPASDTWSPTSAAGAPAGRFLHTAIWTGTEMIVWGGRIGSYVTNTGGRYDPASDMWVPTALTPAPQQRTLPTAVWTGVEMLVWGVDAQLLDKFVYRYAPATDVWIRHVGYDAPDARSGHSAVWTGTEMIVWGGAVTGFGTSLTGGRFNPLAGTWTDTSWTGAPTPRVWHSAVWTGEEMIVWGGCLDEGCRYRLDTGARYDPVADTWSPMSASGAPSARNTHAAVWTGTEMVVWGGQPLTNTGGRYDPASDAWSPTSLAGAPSARWSHTAVWTGTELIVWGGYDGTSVFATGGRYSPSTDTWAPTPTTGAPVARWNHVAVWTGLEMIVWGGNADVDWPYEATATGGRYDPASGGWTSTAAARAPSGRSAHRAVWTGTHMLVWGGFLEPSSISTNTGGLYLATVPRLAGDDTPGVDVAGTGAWFLRNANTAGAADLVFGYGPQGVAWVALEGDWNGDGVDTPGLYDPTSGFFLLRNQNAPGGADLAFGFGPGGAGLVPLAGDWNGDGVDTVGVYAPASGFFFLRNQNAPGGADLAFGFGPGGAGAMPLAGDWDGDGDDTAGVYIPALGVFFLRDANAGGPADRVFGYGPGDAGWLPLVGDWDGDGDDAVGLYDPSSGFFFLKDHPSSGPADRVFGYGPSRASPLTGNWDGR
jgi:hypothetical protein